MSETEKMADDVRQALVELVECAISAKSALDAGFVKVRAAVWRARCNGVSVEFPGFDGALEPPRISIPGEVRITKEI